MKKQFTRNISIYRKEKGLTQEELDIGCGEGKDAVFFARNGYDISAFNLSDAGVEKIRKLVLSLGPQRFNEMRRTLGNISIKSLTDVLRHLVQYKVINRKVFPTVPLTVEYSLTDKDEDYLPVLVQMRKWGENWREHPKLDDGRENAPQHV